MMQKELYPLSLAFALQDGLLSLDDPAAQFITRWRDDPVRSTITIRHLGSHTSGLDDAHNRADQARGINPMKYTGFQPLIETIVDPGRGAKSG